MTKYNMRSFTPADIPYGMDLKQLAGWNQTIHDWQMIIKASQGGNFTVCANGTPVGTITTVSYPPHFSWLGMLLVHPEYRKKGIGTKLLKTAIDYAATFGVVRLDATPAGKAIYIRMGFVEECELMRMVRSDATVTLTPELAPIHIQAESMKNVGEYDKPIFGADRLVILSCLYNAAPQYGFFRTRSHPSAHGIVTGYCLGRAGSQYEQIGPIVADTVDIARHLLISALKACGHKKVIIDVPTGNTEWLREIKKFGFVKLREYTRMMLESHKQFGIPEKQYAIAGPEIG